MKELLQRLEDQGLETIQAAAAINVVAEWMEEHYPIAGALFVVWLQETASSLSESDTFSEKV